MGREQSSSVEVWSRTHGYPGHPDYREFFKDIGKELDRSYLGEYFFAGDTPVDTGFKYHRITGGEDKALYRPWQAMLLAREHARLFIANREADYSFLLHRRWIRRVLLFFVPMMRNFLVTGGLRDRSLLKDCLNGLPHLPHWRWRLRMQ
jgi:predicted glycosyl hydrolase (DUF1957 family)